ncbi:MAG: amino acid ABC transporter substrate-binding protein, partial [Deltaproteobacteria bacterium]|nr:amino acid ABC transporter substrate-binding protein [Deltaproteobacteria bacterium]
MKKIIVLIVLSIVMAAGFACSGTLEDVQKKGVLTCGISEGVPGFSITDSKGHW